MQKDQMLIFGGKGCIKNFLLMMSATSMFLSHGSVFQVLLCRQKANVYNLLPSTKKLQYRESPVWKSCVGWGNWKKTLPLPQEVRWSHILNSTFPSWHISSSSCSCSQQQGGVTAVQLQTEAQVASASGQQVQTLQVVVLSLTLCKHCMNFSFRVWCCLW